MKYKPFADETDPISIVGFGASPLGNVFGPTSRSMDETLVGSAVDHGINFFDVSPYYGQGHAEERLGAALKPHRKDVFLATKCGRYGVDRFDFSSDGILRGVEESLVRLQTDHVDLLQVHDIEFGDINQIVNETLPTLVGLRDEGKTRFIGITGYWPGLLSRTLERFRTHSVLNYCHWNFFADDMDASLTPMCQRLGLALINASPLHMGLMSGGSIAPWHFAPANVREKADEAVQICREFGVEPGIAAIAKCLQHPYVTSTLVGIADLHQVKSACAAVDVQLPALLVERLNQLFAPVLNVCWPQGRPENQDASFRESEQPVAKA